jgi:kynureninase
MTDTAQGWSLETDLTAIRSQFPILERNVYLISNSLGAVPMGVEAGLRGYYSQWAEQGVGAWRSEWWDLSRRVGNLVASLIGAAEDSVSMLPNATNAHWIALSTLFRKRPPGRDTIIMTELDFPSTIYAVSEIAAFMGWRVRRIKGHGRAGIDWEEITREFDERTLCVAVSHVFFKSAAILGVQHIAREARLRGIPTLIDGYHAPGTIPVNVTDLGVDFYVGGCLKWLCGGPGNAFLYVCPERAKQAAPALTGWLGHRSPFRFEAEMEHTDGSYRFMSGTPPVPCLYTAMPGLEIIRRIGVENIRARSLKLTASILEAAQARGFPVFTPSNDDKRAGAVSFSIPHAFQVKQALERRGIMVDFRKGSRDEEDVIRVGPHFYTLAEETGALFEAVDEILASGEHMKYPDSVEHVT